MATSIEIRAEGGRRGTRSAGRVRLLLPCKRKPQTLDAGTPHRTGDSGSSLVEFALSCTILFALVFGVMAMSLALYGYHFISDAARAGTRYAMVRGSSCSTNGNFASNCPVTTSAQVQTYVQGLSLPGINPNNMTVTATWSADSGVTWSSTATSYNAPGDLVKVVVNYQFPLSIPWVPRNTLNMSSTAETVIAD